VKRVLVLGGGGVIGVAWEVGLLTGLAEGGVDVREADAVVGTSAGSMVGSWVAAGLDFSGPAREPSVVRSVPIPESGPDLAKLGEVFQIWSTAESMSEATLREIGTLATAATTVSQQEWIASTGGGIGVEDWPEKPLHICAVDVATGEFRVHTRDTGAPLHAAVASSCAIPGMFPPIEIDGAHYMDGGVRSGTSADVALEFEPESVVIVAPIIEKTTVIGALAERCLADEVAALERAGAEVSVILPEDAEVEAFGGNLMDPTHADAAGEAGHARGLELGKGGRIAW
jgi:NTE family protein